MIPRRLYALSVTAAFLLGGPAPARAEPEDRINAYICASTSVSITPWRQTLSRSIARALAGRSSTKVRVMGKARCGAESVEFACVAGVFDHGGRTLVCSPDTLLKLLRVAAWYALEHADRPDEAYEAFRLRQPAPIGAKAFSASAPDGAAATNIDMRIERLRGAVEATSGQGATRQEVIFVAIFNMTLAAIFGHEASHLEEKPPYCAVDQHSLVEDSGLWKVLLKVSSTGELYKSTSPRQGEVTADRCAARRVRLERLVLSGSALSSSDHVRRAAADIVSTILVSRDVGVGARPVFRVNDAYLLPPFRILAIAGEIGADGQDPKVCGGAAENLVEAAQQTFRIMPGKGLMPDEMEHAFPRGVIDAWERKVSWAPAAFACPAP